MSKASGVKQDDHQRHKGLSASQLCVLSDDQFFCTGLLSIGNRQEPLCQLQGSFHLPSIDLCSEIPTSTEGQMMLFSSSLASNAESEQKFLIR